MTKSSGYNPDERRPKMNADNYLSGIYSAEAYPPGHNLGIQK